MHTANDRETTLVFLFSFSLLRVDEINPKRNAFLLHSFALREPERKIATHTTRDIDKIFACSDR